MDEQEVEQTLRDGLARRAEVADVTAPVAARARAAVARRQRTRWSVVGAAAAVVLVVGGIAVVTRGGGDEGKEPPSVADSGTTGVSPPVTAWRTEYYDGVAVDVPADWGYGGAPLPGDRLTVCAPGGAPGYVGRPVVMTDVCTYLRSGWQPTAPYVWLGGNVEPGTYEWDNGYVQETIEVAGTTVTVGAGDGGLRQQILDSARIEHICPPRLEKTPPGRRENSIEGHGEMRTASVCAYRREGAGYELVYAAPLDEKTVQATWATVDGGPASETVGCDPDEIVVVSSDYNDPYSSDAGLALHWDAVFRLDCADVDGGEPLAVPRARIVKLEPDMVRPWAGRGVRSVLSYFIGPQG